MRTELDKTNLFAAIFLIIGFIAILILHQTSRELTFFECGIVLFVVPLVPVFRSFILMNSETKGFLDIYLCFFTGRLKYYDWGSRLLGYTMVSIQVIGLFFILSSYF